MHDNKIPKEVTAVKKLMHVILIEFWHEYYDAVVYIEESIFQLLKRIDLISISFLGCSEGKHLQLVTIQGCQFLNNSGVSRGDNGIISVIYPWCGGSNVYDKYWLNTTNMKKVQIFGSYFINNTAYIITSNYYEIIFNGFPL